MSATTEAEIQALVHTLLILQGSNFTTAAAIALIAYDICLTIGEEVNFIWRAKWSFPKCLYLVARYYGMVNAIVYAAFQLHPNVSIKLCTIWLWFFSFSANVVFMTFVNMVLVLRINALYGNRRKILIFLLSLITVEFMFEFSIAFYESYTAQAIARPPFPPVLGCSKASKAISLSLIAWSVNLTIASTFYVMTVVQVVRSHNMRNSASFLQNITHLGATNTLGVFFRDGSIFFAMIFAVGLLNLICFAIGGEIAGFGLPWTPAVFSVAGSRLILNLKTSRVSSEDTTLSAQNFYVSTFRAAQGGRKMLSDSPSDISTSPIAEAGSEYDCYALEEIHSS